MWLNRGNRGMSSWGSVSYRPSASSSYEASSHVNNYAYSGKIINYHNYVISDCHGINVHQ